MRGVKDNLLGHVFDHLTVVGTTPGKRGRLWVCQCECGQSKAVSSAHLKKRAVTSCGCKTLGKRRTSALKHGGNRRSGRSKEYSTWAKIIGRCTNPNDAAFPDYGGRGITVCQEWVGSFQAFFDHIGPAPSNRHSIDRIDNEKGYHPGNVRWATAAEQSRNTRRNVFVDGLCLVDACKLQGIKYSTAQGRLRRGASVEQAMSPLSGKAYRAILSRLGGSND